VLAGVFCPTLSMQLLNGVLAAALVVVLVLWSVSYLAWKRPGQLARRPTAPVAASSQWDKIASGLAKQEAAETPPVESPPPASPAPEETPKPASEGGPSNA